MTAVKTRGQDTREKIITTADNLFYEKGYNNTSFADVAAATGVQKGNFYYHFKTKEELLSAVIAFRMNIIDDLLAQCEEKFPTPKQRLKRIVDILKNETHNVLEYGCPMGSLNVELGKQQKQLQSQAAQMFDRFIYWCEKEFGQLGQPKKEAQHMAMHLMATLQGAALLANVYRDEKFINREVRDLKTWIDQLPE